MQISNDPTNKPQYCYGHGSLLDVVPNNLYTIEGFNSQEDMDTWFRRLVKPGQTMTGPCYFPRPPSPPSQRNPWVNPLSAATLAAGIALLFDSEAIAIVFFILAGNCLALTILHERLQP
jgi:hypothetical protein